jgi:hypothetical protein
MDNFFVLTKENTSKKWIIFKKNYVFLVAIYLVSTFFLFPKFYKYEKPNNVLWEETKKDFLQIVDKWDQKICCPKGFWRIFSYFVFVKRKFKHLK